MIRLWSVTTRWGRLAIAAALVALMVAALLVRLRPGAADETERGSQNLSRSVTGSLIEARAQHTATRLTDGRVLVVGGYGADAEPLASAEIYDPHTGDWSAAAALNVPRAEHTTIKLTDGRVLVVGGFGRIGALASAEIYDPVRGQWTRAGEMPRPRVRHATALLPDERVVVAGGCCFEGRHLAAVDLYDPRSDRWLDGGNLHEGRSRHTLSVLDGGHVLVSGGYNQRGHLRSAEMFDPHRGNWQPVAPLRQPRYLHAAAPLPDGSVLVESRGTAERFDLVRNVWEAAEAPPHSRYGATTTSLPGSRILFIGGTGPVITRAGHQTVGSIPWVDVFDATTGTWQALGTLPVGRAGHSVTRLADGAVLVVGGIGGSPSQNQTYLASALLIDPGV